MIQRMLVLFGLALAAGAPGAEPLVDGDPEAGAEKAAPCAACHGANGNSSNPEWPKLAGQNPRYTLQQLQLFKSGERDNPIMMGQAAGLSEQDMKDLAVYYAQQQTQPGVADEALVEAGKTLYFGGNPEEAVPACSGCHGPAGQGNAAAGYPQISGQHAQYVAGRLRAYRDGEAAHSERARIMVGAAGGMSDEEIEAVASFISGLRPAQRAGRD